MTSDIPIGAAVLSKARSGDAAAFEQLMKAHERRVIGVAVRLTGNLADAQDAAQEVFLKLHHHLSSIEHPVVIAPWLYKVTLNVCFDLCRKRRTPMLVPVDSMTDVLRSEAPDAERCAVQRENSDRLTAALLLLGERERAALVLRDLEGLSTAEVAQALGSTESTVRVQISKARLKLRSLLKESQ